MRPETEQTILTSSLGVLKAAYPRIGDLLISVRLDIMDDDATLVKNLERVAEQHFRDFGTTRIDFVDTIASIIEAASSHSYVQDMEINVLSVLGGHDKEGKPETGRVNLACGEVVGVVGRTGAGKSQLLADIECLAQADTPSGRTVLVNGQVPDEELRMSTDNQLIAQLSQNMNFIMDHSVEQFLRIHADSRGIPNSEAVVERVFTYANCLAGEHFDKATPVTQLSGGQSRALMIADTLLLSASPIILIDEIENAGIDRMKAVELLAQPDKIVLISTHDPLLALSCTRRIVIKNGGIAKVIERDKAEEYNRAVLDRYDACVSRLRELLRDGEPIDGNLAAEFRRL